MDTATARFNSTSVESGKTSCHEDVVPPRAVLVVQQYRLTPRPDARPRSRRLELHERDEAVNLRFLRHQSGQDAAKAKRLLQELGPHPRVARRRRIALVEDEVDRLENRSESLRQLVAGRHLEWHVRRGKRLLGAH